MSKHYSDINVFDAAKERINYVFDNFERIYISFSGGKDSTVMLHMVMSEAIKRNKKVAVLCIDLEGQYKLTIDHIRDCYEQYSELIEPYWVCLPIHLRNAVSVFETHWKCWDKEAKKSWIRELPKMGISDYNYFDFFHDGMEFEEFVPLFGKWYSQGKSCACFVGIRSDESLNRYRTITSKYKKTHNDKKFTNLVVDNVYKMAQKLFGQSTVGAVPPSVVVGRRQIDSTTFTPTVTDATPYTVTVNGVPYTITSGTGATATAIVTALKAAIGTPTGITLSGTTSLTVAPTVAGSPWSVTASSNLTGVNAVRIRGI